MKNWQILGGKLASNGRKGNCAIYRARVCAVDCILPRNIAKKTLALTLSHFHYTSCTLNKYALAVEDRLHLIVVSFPVSPGSDFQGKFTYIRLL